MNKIKRYCDISRVFVVCVYKYLCQKARVVYWHSWHLMWVLDLIFKVRKKFCCCYYCRQAQRFAAISVGVFLMKEDGFLSGWFLSLRHRKLKMDADYRWYVGHERTWSDIWSPDGNRCRKADNLCVWGTTVIVVSQFLLRH